MNLQNWCSEWRISINSMNTNYIVLYDKKNKAQSVQIAITVDDNCLRKVSSKRVLRIIIDEEVLLFMQKKLLKKANKHITS